MPFYGRFLLLIAIEGFVTLSLQVLTIRQLMPFVGNSIIVTGTIIGVFLLFLALGYKKGGTYTNNFTKVLSRNFLKSAALSGVGLSYIFLELVFSLSNVANIPTLLTLIVYLLVIISPLVYYLGQTIPIATNLAKEGTVGKISGNALFLSTIGSFLGSIITAVVMMNTIGISFTVLFNFILLILLYVIVNNWEPALKKSSIVVMTCSTAIVFMINVQFEKFYFLDTTLHADYRVIEINENEISKISPDNPGKAFVVNRSYSSFINNDRKGFEYLERIKTIVFDQLGKKSGNVLILGAGGFTASAENNYSNKFVYVDIDPKIRDIASKHFVGDIDGEFVVQDARIFMKYDKRRWDVILSDTFSNGSTIPFHLVTREHLTNIKDSLAPGGVAAFNIISSVRLDDAYSKRMDNTMRAVFDVCHTEPLSYKSEQPVNMIYICFNNMLQDDRLVYTDNINPSTIDYFVR